MTLAADLIRYSQTDDQDHAFVEHNRNRAVWRARCGQVVLSDRVFHVNGETPTCRGCIGLWLQAIIEQGSAMADRIDRMQPDDDAVLSARTESSDRVVWGASHTTETHYLRVYLAQLRRKLEPEPARPRHLVTEPGMGYRFES